MHDHIATVEQHPSVLSIALIAARPHMQLPEPVFDGIGDCLNLPGIRASADYEIVGDDGLFVNIQHDHIGRLLIHSNIGDEPGEFGGIQLAASLGTVDARTIPWLCPNYTAGTLPLKTRAILQSSTAYYLCRLH